LSVDTSSLFENQNVIKKDTKPSEDNLLFVNLDFGALGEDEVLTFAIKQRRDLETIVCELASQLQLSSAQILALREALQSSCAATIT
jgi:hypothetical protein